MYNYHHFTAPFGKRLYLAASEKGLCSLTFHSNDNAFFHWFKSKFGQIPDKFPAAELKTATGEIKAYFEGTNRDFTVPLDLQGTDFQIQVWRRLLQIPFGQTCTYGRIAEKLGGRKLSRAVGLANGSNPISIIVPCHRVIGSNGNLTGYGGGIEVKRWLLSHEGCTLFP